MLEILTILVLRNKLRIMTPIVPKPRMVMFYLETLRSFVTTVFASWHPLTHNSSCRYELYFCTLSSLYHSYNIVWVTSDSVLVAQCQSPVIVFSGTKVKGELITYHILVSVFEVIYSRADMTPHLHCFACSRFNLFVKHEHDSKTMVDYYIKSKSFLCFIDFGGQSKQ